METNAPSNHRAHRNALAPEEARLFRLNYSFMWTTLGSSPYLVKSGQTRSSHASDTWLRGVENLPSYAICFACYRDDYIPSRKTVFGIVDFFNSNFTPAITPWQFLHEDLSQSPLYLSKPSRYDEYFIGVYNCYYPASREENNIFGGVLKIFRSSDMLKAFLITSIRSDEAFSDPVLRSFVNTPSPNPNDFRIFQDRYAQNSPFVKKGRRYYYFEGNVEVTDSSVLIVFRCYEGNDARKLIVTLNIQRLPSLRSEPYHGGLAFVLTTSDTPYMTRLYPMGLINDLYGRYSLQDECISKSLKLHTNGRDIRLTDKADDVWNDLALANLSK